MTDPLTWLAARVTGDPYFLAASLDWYARSERLDDTGLAAVLGCTTQDLARLKLCRPPRPEVFWADVTILAGHFRLDADRLAEVVRRGQAIQQWRQLSGVDERGTLLAARDDEFPRNPPPEEQ